MSDERAKRLLSKYFRRYDHKPDFNPYPSTTSTTEKITPSVDDVVNTVRDIVLSAASPETTLTSTETVRELELERNATLFDPMTDVLTFNDDRNVTLVADNDTMSNPIDWLDEAKHNLTMVQGMSKDDEYHDQTLYIILGIILGVLIMIALVLLLIYVTYKRKNLYTLQERASSSVAKDTSQVVCFESAIESGCAMKQ